MPQPENQFSTPAESTTPLDLTDLIKSRILDRVLRDLAQDTRLGVRPSLYTRSESGIYGKYEKYDADVHLIIRAVREELEQMATETRDAEDQSALDRPPPDTE